MWEGTCWIDSNTKVVWRMKPGIVGREILDKVLGGPQPLRVFHPCRALQHAYRGWYPEPQIQAPQRRGEKGPRVHRSPDSG